MLLFAVVLVWVAADTHKAGSEQQATGDAVWHLVQYESQATFKIFKVKYEAQADLRIFKVKHLAQAGWRTQGHVLEGKLGK